MHTQSQSPTYSTEKIMCQQAQWRRVQLDECAVDIHSEIEDTQRTGRPLDEPDNGRERFVISVDDELCQSWLSNATHHIVQSPWGKGRPNGRNSSHRTTMTRRGRTPNGNDGMEAAQLPKWEEDIAPFERETVKESNGSGNRQSGKCCTDSRHGYVAVSQVKEVTAV
ncbi:hypothetical protein FISHEDRAFT_61813 [Fistulina hepatica ATCC 64428]|uniref:Uncharacterized protein n=1 Tax=Fistulina hepatica ATCC 64428 TaxID=1128425 RepID=A0A0D7A2D4_9AGAR|nr:hypothetical protein FISHEDRAFT_61813 [Fistulina hepatica ATCC 64428]